MTDVKVTTFNTEGISDVKTDILSKLEAGILCVQETHKASTPPDIPGMHFILHHGSNVYGSAVYARNKSIIVNSEKDISEASQSLY